jgi:hypothetical protein
MDKLRTNPKPQPADRRHGDDRRQAEKGPPGRHDRRRGMEARKPEVIELEMSNSEWIALNQQEPFAPTE